MIIHSFVICEMLGFLTVTVHSVLVSRDKTRPRPRPCTTPPADDRDALVGRRTRSNEQITKRERRNRRDHCRTCNKSSTSVEPTAVSRGMIIYTAAAVIPESLEHGAEGRWSRYPRSRGCPPTSPPPSLLPGRINMLDAVQKTGGRLS